MLRSVDRLRNLSQSRMFIHQIDMSPLEEWWGGGVETAPLLTPLVTNIEDEDREEVGRIRVRMRSR